MWAWIGGAAQRRARISDMALEWAWLGWSLYHMRVWTGWGEAGAEHGPQDVGVDCLVWTGAGPGPPKTGMGGPTLEAVGDGF